MGRYATRGERARRAAARRALRRPLRRRPAGAPRRRRELLDQEARAVLRLRARRSPLDDASRHLQAVELALEARRAATHSRPSRAAVEGYNQDDCRSTEGCATGSNAARGARREGHDGPAARAEGRASRRNVGELRAARSRRCARACSRAFPPTRATGHAHHPRWLLAYLLDWHRREDKAEWWEYYRLRDLPEDDCSTSAQAIAGLEFVERVDVVLHKKTGKPTGSVVDRYRYPPQESRFAARASSSCRTRRSSARSCRIDRARAHDRRQKGRAEADVHPPSAFQHEVIIADVAAGSAAALRASRATRLKLRRGLLLRQPPRLASARSRRWPTRQRPSSPIRLATSSIARRWRSRGRPAPARPTSARR